MSLDEAKADWMRLLAIVERGNAVTITRAGRPIARLVPVESAPKRVLGLERGQIWISDDCDAPMPEVWLGN